LLEHWKRTGNESRKERTKPQPGESLHFGLKNQQDKQFIWKPRSESEILIKKISSHFVPCEANFPPTAYSRPVLFDPRPVLLDPRTVPLDPRTVPLDPRLATSTSSPAISK
jgi:hypothetical protein